MAITLLKNGKYKVRVREGGRGSKEHTKYDIETLYEAAEYESFLMRRFGKSPKAGLTFKELAERYESYYLPRLKRGDAKKETMDLMIKQFGGYKVAAFNSSILERYQNEKIVNGKLAPATVNRHIANIKAMFTWGCERGFVSKEVNEDVHKVKMLPENNARLRYLTRAEADTLLEKCADYIRPIVTVALYTGMRKGEIMRLKWIQVDLTNRVILLDQNDTKNKSRREIPLNQTVVDTLSGLIRNTENDRVFWNVPAYWRKAFSGALRRSRINDFKFHDLRHTFCSWLAQAGVPLKTIMELAGHKSLAMTNRYAHLAPDNRKDAVNLLDSSRGMLVGCSFQKQSIKKSNG